MNLLRAITMFSLGLLLAAAYNKSDNEPARARESALLLPLARQHGADSLVPRLVTRQREFFALVSGGSGRDLGAYLETGFAWNSYPRSNLLPQSSQAEAGYFAMLAGYRPSSLDSIPNAYDVHILSERAARVYAELPRGGAGIVTNWHLTGGVWHATNAWDVNLDLRAWQSQMHWRLAR